MGRQVRYAFDPGYQVTPNLVVECGIGQGAFGEVYKGLMRGERGDREVALKYIRPGYEVEVDAVGEILNKTHAYLVDVPPT